MEKDDLVWNALYVQQVSLCQKPQGVLKGNQPPRVMTSQVSRQSLPGYEGEFSATKVDSVYPLLPIKFLIWKVSENPLNSDNSTKP